MLSRKVRAINPQLLIAKPLAAIKSKKNSLMNRKELLELSDDELMKKAKKLKSASFINALFIGFCIGIIIWSVVKNTWGFLTLIPLYFIYKVVTNSKNDKELKEVLKERKLM